MYKRETNLLIDEYLDQIERYEDFAHLLATLCRSFLNHAGIRFHSIKIRVKTPESLREKIGRKRGEGKHYQSLQDITDLAGIRIILYFSDDIERTHEILHQEFNVDLEKSFRKHPKYQQKQMHGYIAEQEIISLSEERSELKEYTRYENLNAEIQIKSVLQHAWSEIEHGIWYKPKVKESELEQTDIRNLFDENAELLKQVDRNFVKIRERHIQLLTEYTAKIERHRLKEIPINFDSLQAYLRYTKKEPVDRKILYDAMEIAQKHHLTNLFQLEEYYNSNINGL